MSKGQELIIILGCFILLVVAVVIIEDYSPKVRYYDCSLAEISPDFPIEVKTECRKIKQITT